ncbi:unnamed protein product [Sphagnum troendelagicum]|uniref:Uncharacterized protein n=2 Tax=Sphagnum TaxID=13804 RepID=A0ABP0TQY4_9BRYO
MHLKRYHAASSHLDHVSQGADGIKLWSGATDSAAQLNDRPPEAHDTGRKLVLDLHTAYCKCPDTWSKTDFGTADSDKYPWEQFCQSKLSPIIAQAVLQGTCIAT